MEFIIFPYMKACAESVMSIHVFVIGVSKYNGALKRPQTVIIQQSDTIRIRGEK